MTGFSLRRILAPCHDRRGRSHDLRAVPRVRGGVRVGRAGWGVRPPDRVAPEHRARERGHHPGPGMATGSRVSDDRSRPRLSRGSTLATPGRAVELPPQRQDPIRAFVDVYMGHVRHCSPATLVSYRLDLRRLRLFLDAEGKSLLDATRADLARFVATLVSEGKARNTIRREIAVLRSFYGWTERQGLTATNPAAVIERPSEQRRLPPSLDRSEKREVSWG